MSSLAEFSQKQLATVQCPDICSDVWKLESIERDPWWRICCLHHDLLVGHLLPCGGARGLHSPAAPRQYTSLVCPSRHGEQYRKVLRT